MTSDQTATVTRLAALLADEPAAQRKVCPACGASFPCLPGGCWCSALRLSPATLRQLRDKYDNCLCPACLLALCPC